jgi:hypothetical protein
VAALNVHPAWVLAAESPVFKPENKGHIVVSEASGRTGKGMVPRVIFLLAPPTESTMIVVSAETGVPLGVKAEILTSAAQSIPTSENRQHVTNTNFLVLLIIPLH